MTTTDDARLVEIGQRLSNAITDSDDYYEDVRYLIDRLKAAESRIRAAKSVIGRWESYDSIHADASRALSQIEEALHSDEVQEEWNGVR